MADQLESGDAKQVVHTIVTLRRKVIGWRLAGLPEPFWRPLAGSLDALPPSSAIQSRDLEQLHDQLLRLEGGLMGLMVRKGRLPDTAQESLVLRLQRREEMTPDSIRHAYRRTQEPWVDAFRSHLGVPSLTTTKFVRHRRLMPDLELSEQLLRPTFLKLASDEPFCSYQFRGAINLLMHYVMNAVLDGIDVKQATVVTTSDGDGAPGVVHAARRLGIEKIIIYQPVGMTVTDYRGVEIRPHGAYVEEAEEAALRFVEAQGPKYFHVPIVRHDLIAEGRATVGIEISRIMKHVGLDSYAVATVVDDVGLLHGLAVLLGRQSLVTGIEDDYQPLGQWALGSAPGKQDDPLVLVVPERPVAETLRQYVAIGLARSYKARALVERLRRQGFIADDGSVGPLSPDDHPFDFRRGFQFIDAIAEQLPEEWDLIDAIRQINFGPYREVKGVRETLRSLGQWQEREYGKISDEPNTKWDALDHPLRNRAAVVSALVGLVGRGRELRAEMEKVGMADLHIARLAAEVRVIEHYSKRPDWIKKLNPALTDKDMMIYFMRLLNTAGQVKADLKVMLNLLVTDSALRDQLCEALDRPR